MFEYDLGGGARLGILQPYHAVEFLEFVNAHRAQLGEWLLWVSRTQTLDDARTFLQEGMDDFARDETPIVGIWQDGRLAGGIAFFPTDKRIRSTELAYWLGDDFSGRGLMTRALRAMLRYLFVELKINRVVIRVEMNNTRSRAVAERLGFELESIEREGWVHAGQMVDLAVYALLAEEWRARRGNS